MANATDAEVVMVMANRPHRETAIESRVANMRRMLGELTELSDADALRALRDAFPEATLAERVRALTHSRH